MINAQSRSNEFCLKCLIGYYILFNLPAIRVYVSTYISIVFLAVLFVVVLCSVGNYGKAENMVVFMALLYALLLLLGKSSEKVQALIALWQVLLECLPLALGCFLMRKKYDSITRVIVLLIFLTYIFTCFTTYAGLLKYPLASRQLATGRDYGVSYTKLNIGGFEFIYSLIVAHPAFVYFLRKRKHALCAGAISILFASCIVASQYATALIGYVFSLVAYALPIQDGEKTRRRTWIWLVAVLVIVFAFASRILIALSEMDVLASISDKLVDAAKLIRGEETSMTNTTSRMKLYGMSFNTFLKHPVLGGEIMGEAAYGGHSWILDMMARWGAIGIAVAVALIGALQKWYRTLFSGSAAYQYVRLSLILALIFASVNPIFLTYVLGVVVPALAYDAQRVRKTKHS